MEKKSKANKKLPIKRADNSAKKTANQVPSVAVYSGGTSPQSSHSRGGALPKSGGVAAKKNKNQPQIRTSNTGQTRSKSPQNKNAKNIILMPKSKSFKGRAPNNLQSKKLTRKTARKRKFQRRLITGTLTATLLFICVFISLKVLFIVREVQAVGSERYTAQEIVEYCAIPLEENIFLIDIQNMSKLLVENFTYIEQAKIRRRLPDKIQITITDSVPTYYSENTPQGGTTTYTVLSQNFKTLTAQAQQPENLLCLSADFNDEEVLKTVKQLIEIKETLDFQDITKIDIISLSDIQMSYQNRITIKLGTMLDMEYKLKMAKHVLLNEIEPEVHGTLDSTKAGSAVIKPNS
ncbi:MAG: FtsQ-type POTRA domain-containing protein [Oscillospiraceae bacterium]